MQNNDQNDNKQKPERVIRIQMSTLIWIGIVIGIIAGQTILATLGGVR
jgi:hypothetical protein